MLSVERGPLGAHRSGPRPGRPVQLPAAPLFDPLALGAVAILAGLGLANLAALGDRSVVQHQLVVDAAGVALFVVLLRWRSDGLRWLGWGCYVVSLLLLMAVDVGGSTVNGARRWLAFGSFTMQPSELAKLGLLLVLAQVLGSDRSWPRRLVAALAVAALPIALVVTQPDLSTAAVLCCGHRHDAGARSDPAQGARALPRRRRAGDAVRRALATPLPAGAAATPSSAARPTPTAPAGRSCRCTSRWPGAA